MSVRNGSDRRLWFIRNVLDPDFYSAEEAALLVQGDVPERRAAGAAPVSSATSRSARCWRRGPITEGFVFLPRVEGGRYVDIRLQGDAYVEASQQRRAAVRRQRPRRRTPRELRFEFALPLPDGDFDYERLDPAQTYAGRALPDLALEELRATLEQLPCCATDADGKREGDPLNVVLVGESHGRAELADAQRLVVHAPHHLRTVRREVGAAVGGHALCGRAGQQPLRVRPQAGRRAAARAPLDRAAQSHAAVARAVPLRGAAGLDRPGQPRHRRQGHARSRRR